MIAAIVAAVAVIVILFSMILSSFAGGGQEEFVIPKVVGMTVEEALADAEISEKYTIETIGSEFSGE